jgi:hypothetical protein
MAFCNQANQAQGVLDPATLDALSKYGSTFSFFPIFPETFIRKCEDIGEY